MAKQTTTDKYLTHHAEPVIEWLEDFPCKLRYDTAIVIPAFDESHLFIQAMQHTVASSEQTILVICVLNCPEQCSQPQRENTQALSSTLRQAGTPKWVSKLGTELNLIETTPTLHWLVWDLSKPSPSTLPLFEKHQYGVGYARKLGMDSALALLNSHQIKTPYLYSSDADACWPREYFTAIPKPTNDSISSYIFPFIHTLQNTTHSTEHSHPVDTPTGTIEAQLYEVSLRYYVAGLRWSGSPWGFHTVGSTLAIHGKHYAANRGFPKREAGEDFYLLNKLAKTGAIVTLKKPIIQLSDRPSHRVPFGTGPAIQKINGMQNWSLEFLFYHPEIFSLLKCWHQIIPTLFHTALNESLAPFGHQGELLLQTLTMLGVEKSLNHCKKHCKSQDDFVRHLFNWFDAFRTLKFIHHLRNLHLPSINFNTCYNKAAQGAIAFLELDNPDTSKPAAQRLAEFSEHLWQQEQQTAPHIAGNVKSRITLLN